MIVSYPSTFSWQSPRKYFEFRYCSVLIQHKCAQQYYINSLIHAVDPNNFVDFIIR